MPPEAIEWDEAASVDVVPPAAPAAVSEQDIQWDEEAAVEMAPPAPPDAPMSFQPIAPAADALMSQDPAVPFGASDYEDAHAIAERAEAEKDAGIASILGDKPEAEVQANILALAKKHGTSPSYVSQHYDEFQKAFEVAGNDPRKFRKDNPGLAKLALERDPLVGKMIVADKPLNVLTKLLLRAAPLLDTPVALRDAEPRLEGESDADYITRFDKRSEELQAQREAKGAEALLPHPVEMQVDKLSEAPPADEGVLDAMARIVTRPGRLLAGGYRESKRGLALGAVGWDAMFAKEGSPEAFEASKRIADINLRMAPRYYGAGPLEQLAVDAGSAVASVVDMAKTGGVAALAGAGIGLAASVGTKGRVPLAQAVTTGAKLVGGAGAAYANIQAEGGAFFADTEGAVDMKGAPISRDVRTGGALLYAPISTALEGVSLATLFKTTNLRGVGVLEKGAIGPAMKAALRDPRFAAIALRASKAWMGGATAEGATEAMQSVAEDAVRFLVANQFKPEDAVANAGAFDWQGTKAKAIESAGAGFAGGLALGAVGSTVGVTRELYAREQNRANGARIATINKMAETASARGAPDAVADLITAETEKSGNAVSSVFIDTKPLLRFFQESGTDAQAGAEALLGEGGHERIQQAVTTGGKLEIPLAEYLEKIGTKPIAKQLERDVAVRPGERTLNEIEASETEDSKTAKDLADKYVAEKTPPANEDEAAFIADVQEQLERSGMKPGDVSAQVALFRAVANTQHESFRKNGSNLSQKDFFAHYRLAVERRFPGQGTTAPATAFNQEEQTPDDASILAQAVSQAEDPDARAEPGYRDAVSGLLSERAWKARPLDPQRLVASLTSSDVKPLNDDTETGGHDFTNAFLREVAFIVQQSDPEAARIGTGIAFEVDDRTQLDAIRAQVKARFPDINFLAELGADLPEAKMRVRATEDALTKKGAIPPRGQFAPGVSPASVGELKSAPSTRPLPQYAVDAAAALEDADLSREVFQDRDSKGRPTGIYSLEANLLLEGKSKSLRTKAMDLGGLKNANKRLGDAAGDLMLAHFAKAVTKVGGLGLRATHRSGDEYSVHGNNDADLDSFAADLRAELHANPALYTVAEDRTMPDGSVVEAGTEVQLDITFRDGNGDGYGDADRNLNRQRKAEQEGHPDVSVGLHGRAREGDDSGRRYTVDSRRGQHRASAVRTPGLQAGVAQNGERFFQTAAMVASERFLQKVFHGSPNGNIGRFALDKVGTGSGRGARGFGIYFSAEQALASGFRDGDGGALYSAAIPENDELLTYERPLRLHASALVARIQGDAVAVLSQSVEDVRNLRGGELYSALSDVLGGDQQASEWMDAHGIPGLRYVDESRRGNGAQNFVVWNEDRMRVLETFNQENKEEHARGFVDFVRTGLNTVAQIVLNPAANKSTFLHEGGHVFLDVMGELAERADAPDRLRNDWEKAKAYLEISSAADLRTPGEKATNAHERWARTFEAYLLEGKAPSPELVRPFARFRQWLVGLYREVAALNVPINDDIRGVLDRLLASDAEIERAKGRQGFRLLTADQFGGTPQEYEAYLRTAERATASGTRKLDARLLKDRARELETWWKEELEDLRNFYGREHDALPTSRVLAAMRPAEGAKTHFDRAAVRRMLGGQAKAFPKALVRKEGGVSPDDVASEYGFPSGTEMLTALSEAPFRGAYAKEHAEAEMRRRFPDVLEERDTLVAEAAKALHGGVTSDMLLREWAALRSRQGGVQAPPVEAVKQAARLIVQQTKVRDLHPARILAAERLAAENSATAAAKGQWAQASVYKQQQLLNHYLYRETVAARDSATSFEELAAKMGTDRRRMTLGKASAIYRDAIDAVLGGLALAEHRLPEDERPTVTALADTISRQDMEPAFDAVEADALIAKMPPRSNGVIPWKSLTVDQLDNFSRILLQTYRLASDANKVLINGKRVALDALVAGIEEDAAARPLLVESPRDVVLTSFRQKYGAKVSAWLSERLEPGVILERLGQRASDFFIDGAAAARTKETELAGVVLKEFNAAMAAMPKEMQEARLDVVPGAAEALPLPDDVARTGEVTRQYLWMVALNMGNASNKARLLGGYRWNEAQVMDFLNTTLKKEEWTFLQGIWDLLDKTLYPEVAKTFEAVNGIPPKKIEAQAFQTPHGEFRGGYFPAKYDPVASRLGERDAASAYEALMANGGTSASVAKGFTKSRAKVFTDVVRLEWNNIAGHIASNIHYVAYDAFVRSAARVEANKGYRFTVDTRLGPAYREQIHNWLKVTANTGATSAADEAKANASVLSGLKGRMTTAALGFSMANAVGDLSNPLVLAAGGFVSPHRMTAAFLQGLGGGAMDIATIGHAPVPGWMAMRKDALAKSAFLRERADDTRKQLQKALRETEVPSTLDVIKEHAFILQETVAKFTSTVSWTAAYRDGLAKGLEDAAAVRHADSVMAKTEISFEPADVSTFLRDKRTTGALVGFHSYFAKLYNLTARKWDPFFVALGNDGFVSAAPQAVVAGAYTMGMFFVASVVGNALMGKRKEDDEEYDEYLLRTALAAPFAVFPMAGAFLETGTNALAYSVTHGGMDGYTPRRINTRSAPAAALLERGYKMGVKLLDDPDVQTVAMTGVQLAAIAAGLPAFAPAKNVEYLWDLAQGERSQDDALAMTRNTIYGAPRN